MKQNPKVSIVTACYNSERYLEDCILSIMRQTYDNVEHIIVDGGSTDGTLDIIKKYDGQYNMRWISEKDNGMYDAITKGFAMADGDIFAWLNSDDMYLPWACEVAAKVMTSLSVNWCTGIPGQYTAGGLLHYIPRVTPVYPRCFIKRGYMDNRVSNFLQQESMFWTRELWEANQNVIAQYKIAGDYHLWKSFAKTDSLYTIDSVFSGIRVHEGQKSENMAAYYREVGELSFGRKLLAKSRIIRLFCFAQSMITNSLRIKMRTII